MTLWEWVKETWYGMTPHRCAGSFLFDPPCRNWGFGMLFCARCRAAVQTEHWSAERWLAAFAEVDGERVLRRAE